MNAAALEVLNRTVIDGKKVVSSVDDGTSQPLQPLLIYMMFYEDDIHPEIQVSRPFRRSTPNISTKKKVECSGDGHR